MVVTVDDETVAVVLLSDDTTGATYTVKLSALREVVTSRARGETSDKTLTFSPPRGTSTVTAGNDADGTTSVTLHSCGGRYRHRHAAGDGGR